MRTELRASSSSSLTRIASCSFVELLEGERSVTALCQSVGLSQSAVSQHLAKLRDGGIVCTRRVGLAVHYSLARDEVRRVIELLHDFYCRQPATANEVERAS